MTVCYLEKLLSPPLLHWHHPGFHMFAASWKGLPLSSEHPHQAHHSEEVEAPQAQTEAGTYSFEGSSDLIISEMVDNSDHRKKNTQNVCMKSYAWCGTGRHYFVTHKLNTQWQHEVNKCFCNNNNNNNNHQYAFSWMVYKCETSLICKKTFSIITNMKQHSHCFRRSWFCLQVDTLTQTIND